MAVKNSIKVACFGILLALAILLVGCGPTQKYERTIQLSEKFKQGNLFSTRTHNGYIHIAGNQTNQCDISAKICGRANSIERAEELCEAVEVRTELKEGDITVVIDRPITIANESTSVEFDILLPTETSFKLGTHNGEIVIKNTLGNAEADTHNGRIYTENLCGDVNLLTHNGEIKCQHISGNSKLQTHNGSIKFEYAENSELMGNVTAETHNGAINIYYPKTTTAPVRVSAVTHNGGIHFSPPAGYSAQITAKTHNGSVNSNLPITISEQVNTKNIQGTIGTEPQNRSVYLETHNGSIKVE